MIWSLARRLRALLIVVGGTGAAGLDYVSLGSVTRRTLRLASCPVMVVPARAPAVPSLPWRRVVVALDFSPGSRQALDFAVDLGNRLGRPELHLIHSHHVPVDLSSYFAESAIANAVSDSAAAQAQIDQWSKPLRKSHWQVETRVTQAEPDELIVDEARHLNADLICLGTHGQSGRRETLLGSTTERVVSFAPCPVVAVGAASTWRDPEP